MRQHMRAISVASAFLCLGLSIDVCSGQEKLVASKVQSSLELMGDTYQLAFVDVQKNRNHTQVLNEYIPKGETLERWTRLVAVFHYPEIPDMKGMPGELVKVVKAHNPLARFDIHQSPDGKKVMVDFVTWDTEKDFTEFNIFIYQNADDGKGVLVHQFARRGYGDESRELLTELKEKRMPTLQAITDFQFPAITKEQP